MRRAALSHTSEVDALVVAELFRGHVAVVLYDFPHVLGRHLLLWRIDVPVFTPLAVPSRVERLPFARCEGGGEGRGEGGEGDFFARRAAHLAR